MDNSNVITHSGKDLIKILDEEINDLHKYFSNLSPSLFTNPSSADGWTNADVLSHITMGALSYHMYLSRALEGMLDPPEGLPSPKKGYLQPDVSTTILESTTQLKYDNVSTLIDMFGANCNKLHVLLSTIGDDEWDKPNGAVIEIPQKAPAGSVTSSAKEQYKNEDSFMFLNRVRDATIHWVNPGHRDGQNSHNVSATVYIGPNEWDEVGEWMWSNRWFYNGMSCFPQTQEYDQPPFETINKKTYDKMMVALKNVDLSQVYENEDNTDFGNELACAGGSCEI